MNCTAGFLLGIGVVASVLSAGCSRRDEPAAEPPAAAAPKTPRPSTEEVWTSEQLVFLKEKFGELQSTSTGLYYKILRPGVGDAKPERAKLCTVHYRGTFLDDRVFDESYKRGQPFKFRVGVPGVIPGWNQAVADMHKGEKRLVVVPYWLGYGVQGRIPVIPPRATLVFEIELLGWETTSKVPTGGE
jgi:FKBP-type peptidyl-prolyl cis-trans isomerase